MTEKRLPKEYRRPGRVCVRPGRRCIRSQVAPSVSFAYFTPTYSIVTTTPNEIMKPLHARMPVIRQDT
jgi:hypothetical protein